MPPIIWPCFVPVKISQHSAVVGLHCSSMHIVHIHKEFEKSMLSEHYSVTVTVPVHASQAFTE